MSTEQRVTSTQPRLTFRLVSIFTGASRDLRRWGSKYDLLIHNIAPSLQNMTFIVIFIIRFALYDDNMTVINYYTRL